MNDRSGKRPTLTPDDDPSIPLLTERLTLPVPSARPASSVPAAATESAPLANVMVSPTPRRSSPSSLAAPAVDGMAFPEAAPARRPDSDVPVFELPPVPAQARAPASGPVTLAAIAPPAPASVSAASASPAAPSGANAIRDALLDDLAVRLPRELDILMRRRLAASIEAAVQAASADLTARVRNAAEQSLQSVIEQVVQAEIARLRPPPKP